MADAMGDARLDRAARALSSAASFGRTVGALAKAEVAAGLRSWIVGLALCLAGGGFAMIAVLFFMHAVVGELRMRGFTEASAYATVGGGLLALALLSILVGAVTLRAGRLAPRRAMAEVSALFGRQE